MASAIFGRYRASVILRWSRHSAIDQQRGWGRHRNWSSESGRTRRSNHALLASTWVRHAFKSTTAPLCLLLLNALFIDSYPTGPEYGRTPVQVVMQWRRNGDDIVTFCPKRIDRINHEDV